MPIKTAFLYWKTIFVSAKIRSHACLFRGTQSSLSLKNCGNVIILMGLMKSIKKIGTFGPSLADLSVDVKITCRSFVSKESNPSRNLFVATQRNMICLLFNFEDFFSPLKNEKVWKLYVESKPCSQGLRKVWKSRGEKWSKAFWSFDYIPAKIWRGGRSPLLPLSSDGPENKGCDIVIFIGVQPYTTWH